MFYRTLDDYIEQLAGLRPKPLFFYDYMNRVLTEQFENLKPKYPQVIRIPKPMPSLLQGDFEPAYEITLNEPIKLNGTPIWFESAANESFLRFGYKNLDARKIGDDKLSMEFIHGFLGGSSGHGKSVTLNSMIGGLVHEYAPWEIDIKLSDAKITEFKKYGMNHRIPHITAIAATTDADFVISMLSSAVTEMIQRSKVFANAGVSNLKSFRKKTGLMLPRVIIVMDEVESTFKLAGKKVNRITSAIDDFARLGRSAGFHIIMATQNMSSDIPSSAVGQIRIRMCLGANQKTSESVLGNSGAQENVGKIGKLITNTEVMNGGDTRKFNIKYQTPFMEDEVFEQEMEDLERIGKEIGYKAHMDFYDEEDIKTIEEFSKIQDASYERMKSASELTPNGAMILGYPAFITSDEDGLLKVHFDGKDIENVCVLSSQASKIRDSLMVICHSLHRDYQFLHYPTNDDYACAIPNTVATYRVRDASEAPFTVVPGIVNRRLFLLTLEQVARGFTPNMQIVKDEFEKLGISQYAGSSLLAQRFGAFVTMAKEGSGYDKLFKPVVGVYRSFTDVLAEYKKYNALNCTLTADMFPKVCNIVGDLAKISGLGRDPKPSIVNSFKKTLQDAYQVGCLFLIYSTSMEGLNDLSTAVRYTVFDVPDSKDWQRMRTEAPDVKECLVVLFDSQDTTDPLKKYKRSVLERTL